MMTQDERCSFDARTRAAISELESIILARYPEATFHVERGPDDPQAIHLVTTVDVEDRTDLLELVVDRQMEIQIEDGIPIFIIPLRTPERNRAVEAALRVNPVDAREQLDDYP